MCGSSSTSTSYIVLTWNIYRFYFAVHVSKGIGNSKVYNVRVVFFFPLLSFPGHGFDHELVHSPSHRQLRGIPICLYSSDTLWVPSTFVLDLASILRVVGCLQRSRCLNYWRLPFQAKYCVSLRSLWVACKTRGNIPFNILTYVRRQ